MTRSTRFAYILGLLTLSLSGQAHALCVTASEANLRSGPGTNYAVSWRVYTYMPLRKIGQRGSWYKVVDVDGEKHWIHRTLISSKLRCGVVKTDRANIRKGPGTRYPQLEWSPVQRYYSFQVLGQSGSWTRIKDEYGDTGWIAKSLTWQ
jgi:SH3-like domain-containing protein